MKRYIKITNAYSLNGYPAGWIGNINVAYDSIYAEDAWVIFYMTQADLDRGMMEHYDKY